METETGLKWRREKSRIGPVPPATFLTWLPGFNVHAFACVFVYVCEGALERGGGYRQSN